jgi:hypothetical protein
VDHGTGIPIHSNIFIGDISMSIYHKHHIIPKHAGGSNDPSNIIELTVEEHALAHKELWEKYGRWQDKVAWICLSKQVSKEEAIKLIISEANLGHKRNIGENNPMYGKTHTAEARVKIGNASKTRQSGKKRGPMSEDRKRKISEALKGKRKSEEHVKKMSEGRKGTNNPNYKHGERVSEK